MTPNRVFFSKEDDDKLIDLIKVNNPLWDREKKNSALKEKLWKDIAKKMDKKSSDCKVRWKTMRDYFKRQTRKKITNKSPDMDTRFKSLMFLHTPKEREAINRILGECIEVKLEENSLCITHDDEQNGINDNISESHSQTYLTENEDTQQIESKINVENATNSTLKLNVLNSERPMSWEDKFDWKSKLTERNNRRENDAVDLFFESIISTVKTFPAAQIARAKLEILNVITKMELELLNDKSSVTTVVTSDTGTQHPTP